MTHFEHPRSIGPYRIVGVIGEGGMGVVYEAEQTEPVRRRVALKMMKAGMDTKEVVGRFEAERQALAMMDHPCIAQVFDAGATDEGHPYFVMELVRGVPLDTYCDGKALTIRQRIELFVEICAGVQHAHQKGIIHRDLKPSNILVGDSEGRLIPKIIDFGIAKATGQDLTDHTVVTTYGQALGTLNYMSPEQAEMGDLGIDTRTDVFALGVILCELLAGRVPMDLREMGVPVFLAELIQRDKPTPTTLQALSALDDDSLETALKARSTTRGALERELGGDLRWIVLKATEKERDRRYGSATALGADLQRYLTDEPIEARAPTTTYRLRKFVRRNRTGVGFAAVAALAIAGGAVASVVGMLRAQRAEAVAIREAATARQVSSFMGELFSAADPETARGATITAREVLDTGAERIRDELTDQPLVRAELMRLLGDVYVSLGVFDEAQSLHRAALDIYATQEEAADSAVAWSQLALAHALIWTGDYAEAEPLALEATATFERVMGTEHKLFGDAFDQVVMGRLASGRPVDDLEPRILEQLESRLRNGLDQEAGNALDHLCWADIQAEDVAGADSTCLQSIDYRRELYGGPHPALIAILGRYGRSRAMQGDLEGEFEAHSEAVEVARAVFEPPHFETSAALSGMAGTLVRMGRAEEARAAAEEVLEIRRQVLDPSHPEVVNALSALASIRIGTGDPVGAVDAYRETVELLRAAGRTTDGHWVTRLNDLGFWAYRTGEFAEADTILFEALRFMESDRDELNQGRNIITTNYARVAAERGRTDEAARYAGLARDRLSESLGAEHWRAAAAGAVLGRTLTQRGEYDAAGEALTHSWEILREAQPRGSAYRKDVLAYLVEWSEARGAAVEAEQWRAALREEGQ